MLEKIKIGDRDPPLWMFISLCVFTIMIIYVLKTYLLDENKSVWGWYLVGIGCVFIVIVVLRQRYIENRWSTYILQLISIFFLSLGVGFISEFKEFLDTYIYVIIFIPIFTFIIKNKLKKDI
jgi:cell division protein FtsW (lipid II flippase)